MRVNQKNLFIKVEAVSILRIPVTFIFPELNIRRQPSGYFNIPPEKVFGYLMNGKCDSKVFLHNLEFKVTVTTILAILGDSFNNILVIQL